MMETKKRSKNAAQLEKEIRELRQAQEIKDRQIRDLKRKQDPKKSDNIFVWSKKFNQEFDENAKTQFIRANAKNLKALFMYSDETARKLKKQQYNTVLTQAKAAFETWMNQVSGDAWKLKELTMVESLHGGGRAGGMVRNEQEDIMTITFQHKGMVFSKIGDKKQMKDSLTPEPTMISLNLSLKRHDLSYA